MERHPRHLIASWTEDLIDGFEQAERRYERALDRGAPREQSVRRVLSAYLPRKYGVTAGHIVSARPAWSRQSDVILYNALEAPVFAEDTLHQGTVLPAESVYGIMEVKSSLDENSFIDAAEKISQFKRLCNEGQWPQLTDRFGAVFAFRIPQLTFDQQTSLLNKCLDVARSYSADERVDGLLVLGTRTAPGSHYAALIPHGDPYGPLDYTIFQQGPINLRLFLLQLEMKLRRIRTGAPRAILEYLFDPATELQRESGPDPRLQR